MKSTLERESKVREIVKREATAAARGCGASGRHGAGRPAATCCRRLRPARRPAAPPAAPADPSCNTDQGVQRARECAGGKPVCAAKATRIRSVRPERPAERARWDPKDGELCLDFSHRFPNTKTSGVLAIVSDSYSPLRGRSPTRYSPVRHFHLERIQGSRSTCML